jgi:RNA polymerase sigma-70 factor (ECF subfamily)
VGAGDHGALRAAVESLPEAQREALLMRFVSEMSLAEIAGALSVPLGTVKSRLHAAVGALSARLGGGRGGGAGA